MEPETRPADRRFYHLAQLIAVLELGARAHGDIGWVELYDALSFLPWASPTRQNRETNLET